MVFRSDPCGITCLIITYSAVVYADYVVVRHLILPAMSDTLWGAFNVLVFNVIVFLMAAAHIRAVISDPGIVPLPQTSLDFSDMHSGKQKMNDGWSVCTKCETYRPPRAHHCRICERCIRRMDHHCPWINNCVGEYNQKYFMQFLFYVGLAAVHASSMVIVSWILDPAEKGEFKHMKVIHSIILVIECLLFGLFVIAIGCDQLSAIFNDETGVEYVKKEGLHRSHSKMFLLREIFGHGHPCWWLCPLMDVSDKKALATAHTV
ncbi:palmitoyltransferase ZDHHC3-like [Mercenaria mercenaria]|uniref:palmitoyltransferase ZDHHC3-like n=1 Tax=Mercenaria mercenaria TaxID=6596 RepID=UPI00234F3A2E|nr:palmitoyltransferase ZDHHC3-like [Mercenaria mercenaria]